MTIEKTLCEREECYGPFRGQAHIAQGIKRAMHEGQRWDYIPDYMTEALEMIAHKIGRIVNGDPTHLDSWHDIIGYAKLVENELIKSMEVKHDY